MMRDIRQNMLEVYASRKPNLCQKKPIMMEGTRQIVLKAHK